MSLTLFLGWDVGGWHGLRDGLAALTLSADGSLEPAGQPRTVSLGDAIARGSLSLELLAGHLDMRPVLESANRVVLGVDAPLGLPRAFVRSASTRFDKVPPIDGGLPKRWIDNPLAFRETDKFVLERTGKRPLSPSLDALANNTSKARAACASLRRHDSRVRIVPFEPDDGEIAVIEVYPALWKRKRKANGELDPTAKEVMRRCQVTDPDQKDAYLCALTAACYELHRTTASDRRLPQVWIPPEELSEAVATEGWIFAPVLAPDGGV